ncbi:ATPase [Alkaliphilus pronyensis]|uniref:ATPase n=1 Tax=Alkaliphilus pronyensis TaxID=1482732 RepID=A0A6I0FLR3_9FIRM|nr:ATPase [Alkaliphilus pronyensis]KAB3539063.1 ATPase [Alkaliphilus pronyensis]
MSMIGNIKRLFPGGNTSIGFYSYYNYVIDLKEANRVYLIKGGPGVGKSQLMKNIGKALVDKGYDAEFHHCSADPDSIDAVVFPKLRIALIDGTSPHVIDPKYPGAVDEIINLGDFWDEKALIENREKIIKSTDDNGKIYKRVYSYLGAAKRIKDDIEWIYNEALLSHKIKEKIKQIKEAYLSDIQDQHKISKQRHLFGSAYTHKGHINFGNTYLNESKTLYIEGSSILINSDILYAFSNYFIDMGYDVHMYHHPLVPDKLESIVIPEVKTAITTLSGISDSKIISTDDFYDNSKLLDYKEQLEESNSIFKMLMEIVFDNLKRTKVNHDLIESFYIPNISFNGVDRIKEDLIEKIVSN